MANKPEKYVITSTSVTHALVHILELTYGAVLISIAQEFGASLFVLGILANIFGFAFGATSLPSGFLVDRTGERRLLMYCCLGMGVSSLTIGLAPNVHVLAAGLMVLGLALGIFHPTGSTFIARVATQRGISFGYFGVGGNIGVALGPILASVVNASLGWRASYFIFAVPAFLLAAMFSFVRTDVPRTQQPNVYTGAKKVSLKPVILPLVLIFCVQSLNGFIYRGIVTFLPLYLGERIHFAFLNLDSVLIAGSFTTVALLFGVGGQFLGGYLSERRRRETLGLLIPVIAMPLLLVMANSEGLALMIAASGFAFFHFMGQPVYNALVADYAPASLLGIMFGISFFCVFGIGSFSASVLGYVADQLGTNWVFAVAAVFGLLAIICTAVLLVVASKTRVRYASGM